MKNVIKFLVLFFCYCPLVHAAVEQQLNVRIGPFDAARVQMVYDIGKQDYAFASKVQTAGFFSKLHQFWAEYSSRGDIKNNKLITKDYRYTSQTKSHHRTKQLVFDESGKLDYRLSSKNHKPKKVDIELPDTPFDASDMQTVFSALVKQFQDNKFCAMQKTVFDGKKNYHITLEDEGKTVLQDSEIPFNGEAWKCSLFIKSLDSEDDDLLLSTTADRPVYFWIMLDEKTKLPFLAKIEIDSTPLGRLKAYTTKVDIKD